MHIQHNITWEESALAPDQQFIPPLLTEELGCAEDISKTTRPSQSTPSNNLSKRTNLKLLDDHHCTQRSLDSEH
jgi:hypothetical protein